MSVDVEPTLNPKDEIERALDEVRAMYDDFKPRSNRPLLQDQVDKLERDIVALRDALGHVMAAIVPAFQALEHIEAAARAMSRAGERDEARG